MQVRFWSMLVALAALIAVVGCGGGTTGNPQSQGPANQGTGQGDDEASIRANLEKLGPEDRKLAEEQGFCAVETENRLGSMGVPFKVEVKGQPVFLCCDGCETRAKAHADRTLARVQQLREKEAGTPAK